MGQFERNQPVLTSIVRTVDSGNTVSQLNLSHPEITEATLKYVNTRGAGQLCLAFISIYSN